MFIRHNLFENLEQVNTQLHFRLHIKWEFHDLLDNHYLHQQLSE